MPKGPNGQKRPADSIGMSVMVAKIATGEELDTSYVSQNRRKSGVAGAKARMETTSAGERSEIATKAAEARWRRENDMIETQSAKSKLSALYAKKRDAGLIDVKFLVGSIDEASFDDVANEVLRLEEAVQRGDYRVIRFNDKH
jgi:hypothetical protein